MKAHHSIYVEMLRHFLRAAIGSADKDSGKSYAIPVCFLLMYPAYPQLTYCLGMDTIMRRSSLMRCNRLLAWLGKNEFE